MAHFETGGFSLTIVYLQMAGDSRVFETHGHLSYLPNSSIRSADKQLHTTAARQQQTTTTISSSFSFGSSKIKKNLKKTRERRERETRENWVSALKLVKSSSSLISHRKKAAALHYKRIFNSLAPPIFIVSLNTLQRRLHPPPHSLYIRTFLFCFLF